MCFATIQRFAGQHPVRKLCRFFGVAWSAYYAAPRKAACPRAVASAQLRAKARELFEASGRTYGSPRLAVALRGRVLRTSDSRHLCPIAPNHLTERAAPPTRPGKVWRADITYVATKEGWLYVAGVLDACSRRFVGWAVSDTICTMPC